MSRRVRTTDLERRPGTFRSHWAAYRVARALEALFDPYVPAKKAARKLRAIYPHLDVQAHHVEALRERGATTDLALLTPAERLAFLEGKESMARYLRRKRVQSAFGALHREEPA